MSDSYLSYLVDAIKHVTSTHTMNNIFATDDEIQYAQDILLGKENHFSAEKIAVIKSNDSKDVVACPGSGR